MHTETKIITQKDIQYYVRDKPKATTKPWFRRSFKHPAKKWNGSILGHTCTHAHMLTYLAQTHMAHCS